MRLLAKYPQRKKMIHDGESAIVYEAGNRVTDISRLGEAFEDLVEETEGAVPFGKPSLVEQIKPSALEVLKTAKACREPVQSSLLAMLLSEPTWLKEF